MKLILGVITGATLADCLSSIEEIVGRKFHNDNIEEEAKSFAARLINDVRRGFLYFNADATESTKKINCIKILRIHSPQLGLKEAKDIIDEAWSKWIG
jgi:ribosomal protein L7/L12